MIDTNANPNTDGNILDGNAAPPEPQAQPNTDPNQILGGGETQPNEGNPEPKTGEGNPTDTPPPQEITIEVPEGADKELVDAFKKVAKEVNLDSAKAQKVVDVFLEAEKKVVAARQSEFAEMQRKWYEEIKSDPEFGGAKFEENKNYANRALEKFGGEEFIVWLKESGLQNQPGLVKMLMRVGQAMVGDSIGGTHSPTTGKQTSGNPLLDFYENSGTPATE